jgi:hypothetical protein
MIASMVLFEGEGLKKQASPSNLFDLMNFRDKKGELMLAFSIS